MAERTPRVLPPRELPLVMANGLPDPAWYQWFQLLETNLGGLRTDRVVKSPPFGARTMGEPAAAVGTINAVIDGITYPLLYAQDSTGTPTDPPDPGGGALSATASPAGVSGLTNVVGPATTDATTVTVMGGVGPFTIAWQYVSGDITVLPTSPTSLTTTFSGDVSGSEPIKVSTYRARVTDTATGMETLTNTVNAAISYVGP